VKENESRVVTLILGTIAIIIIIASLLILAIKKGSRKKEGPSWLSSEGPEDIPMAEVETVMTEDIVVAHAVGDGYY